MSNNYKTQNIDGQAFLELLLHARFFLLNPFISPERRNKPASPVKDSETKKLQEAIDKLDKVFEGKRNQRENSINVVDAEDVEKSINQTLATLAKIPPCVKIDNLRKKLEDLKVNIQQLILFAKQPTPIDKPNLHLTFFTKADIPKPHEASSHKLLKP